MLSRVLSEMMTAGENLPDAAMADLKQRSPAELSGTDFPEDISAVSLAIQRHDTPVRIATFLLYSAGVFLIILVIWAACTVVPEVAVAPGQVIPKGNVKLAQPVADGVVEKIFVKEGEHVEVGTKLVLLDRIPYREEVENAQHDLTIAQSTLLQHEKVKSALDAIIRNPAELPVVEADLNNVSQIVTDVYKSRSNWLEAARDASVSKTPIDTGALKMGTIAASSDMSMLAERLRNVLMEKEAEAQALERRKEEFKEKKKALTIETDSLKRQMVSMKEQKQRYEAILEQTKIQAQAMKEALDAGGVSLQQYLETMKNVETQELSLLNHENELSKTDHNLAVAKAAELEFDSKQRADLKQVEGNIKKLAREASELTMQARDRSRNMSLTEHAYFSAIEKAKAKQAQEADEVLNQKARIEQIRAKLQTAQDKFERAEICSPIEGVVTSIKLRGKGEVVSQKEPLMTIVPLHSDLVIEAQLPNKDIGFVKAGQDVKLKLASFPFQDYGILQGKLIEVEAFPRDVEKLGGYYRIIVEPERTYVMVHGKKIPFATGMSVSAEVITRRRSILSIILEPIKNIKETRWN